MKLEPTEREDSTSEWSLDTSTIGEGKENDVNELKLKMAVLEVCILHTFIICEYFFGIYELGLFFVRR
jgi:hypothetical protein